MHDHGTPSGEAVQRAVLSLALDAHPKALAIPNLVRCRKRMGFSQETLGLRASLHRTEISLLERGTRIPRIDTLVKLAGALDLPAEDLLAGIVWRPGERTPGGFTP